MELKNIKSKALTFLKKYRYVALILVIGLVFMLIPGKTNEPENTNTEQADDTTAEMMPSIDETLAQLLSRIDGAGNVQVLLTLSKGEETIYQTDDHTSVSDETSTTQIETVILSGSDRAQTGLIRQINPPTYLGAIVVCEGADSPSVRLAIVDAVSKVTGLGADRISVLKMK